VRYFITFSCYGTRLHGDESGTVDRRNNTFGHPGLKPSPARAETEEEFMRYSPYEMNEEQRSRVLSAIREVCSHRTWTLLAAHIRSTHVHAIVEAETEPEEIMNTFKRYASRKLNARDGNRKRWSRHGSTRWLWNDQDVHDAIKYVIDEQGEPMVTFVHEAFR
jgi:REP element-mobilizing transposase RayT